MYLSERASAAEIRAAEQARRNRHEIIKALSHGQVGRRELLRWGLFTASGALALKHGLNPFVGPAHADSIPTGIPRSPLAGAIPFEAPMPRFNLFPRQAIGVLDPAPRAFANEDPTDVFGPNGVAVRGPKEGRPPGPIWAHQGFADFPPRVAVEISQKGAETG